jgi:hypothetical protein
VVFIHTFSQQALISRYVLIFKLAFPLLKMLHLKMLIIKYITVTNKSFLEQVVGGPVGYLTCTDFCFFIDLFLFCFDLLSSGKNYD